MAKKKSNQKKKQPAARKEKKAAVKREIGSLLIVVATAVLLAGGVAGFFIWRATPKGKYLGKNVLLAPDILTGAAKLADIDPESRLQRAWIFSRVDYYHHNPQSGGLERHSVSPVAYEAFYGLLEGKRSVRAGEDLACHFDGRKVSTLVLTLDPAGRYAAAYKPKEFVQIEFSGDGELLRVQLHDKNSRGEQWAYFHSSGIGYEASRLFRQGRS